MTTSFAHGALDFERLSAVLGGVGATISLAELHGGVCAALCAGGSQTAERWLAECLEDQQLDTATAEVASFSNELISASSTMLSDDELAFEPLLPNDDAPLAERVQALALWCQGFLAGIGVTAPAAGRGDTDESGLNEIFGDLAEISRRVQQRRS